MFYINNAFLHLELPKSERISFSPAKHIKNTCCRKSVAMWFARLFPPTYPEKYYPTPSNSSRSKAYLIVVAICSWGTVGDDLIGQVAGFSRLLQTGAVLSWLGGYRPALVGRLVGGGNPWSHPTRASHRVAVLHQVRGPRVIHPDHQPGKIEASWRKPEEFGSGLWVSLAGLLVGLSLVRPTASEESKWDNWPSGAVVDWPWRPLVHHKSKWLRDSVTPNQAVTSHQRGLFRLGCLFFAARWQHLPTSSSPADLSLTDTRVLGGVRLKAASILLKVLILGSINLRPSFDFDPTLIIGWRSWSWIPFPGCDLGLLLPRVPWSDRTVALTTLHPLPFHSFGPSNLAPAPHHFFNNPFFLQICTFFLQFCTFLVTSHLHHTTFSITFFQLCTFFCTTPLFQ